MAYPRQRSETERAEREKVEEGKGMKMEEKELTLIEWKEDIDDDEDEDEEEPSYLKRLVATLHLDQYDKIHAYVYQNLNGHFQYYLEESSEFVWGEWANAAELQGWQTRGEAETLEQVKALAEVALRHAEAFTNEWEKLDEQDFPNHRDRSSNYTRFLFEIKKPALEAYAKMLEEYEEVEEDDD